MTALEVLLRQRKLIRVIGFDDAPFQRHSKASDAIFSPPLPVSVAGIICAGTRFEGMIWGQVTQDGLDATDRICEQLLSSKFLPQLHLVLLDGLGFGGFNLIDLPTLSQRLALPCVAVMRRYPNFEKIVAALSHFRDRDLRLQLIQRAGTIHHHPPFFFQVCGEDPDIIGLALHALTDCGKVPEALRIAHLIGAAVKTGESGSQA
ncbi:MAG: DUF99 family protein [Spirulinaceae cyanobacterium]